MVSRYFDTETNSIITWDELHKEWENEISRAERSEMTFGDFSDNYRRTFGDYVKDCCSKNGTLVPIPENLTGNLYYDIWMGDIVNRKTAYNRLEYEYGFDEFTPMSEMWEYFIQVQ